MIDDVIYKPRSGEEVKAAAPPGTKVIPYSSLARIPAKPVDILLYFLGRHNIILYQNPSLMNSGHWVSLSIYPEVKQAHFFSSYGGKPDEEKIRWVPRADLIRSGQGRNILNDGLKELHRRGWEIHYNDYPFQKEGDDTASCGIWTVAFLNSHQNPDSFAKYHHRSPHFYYTKYF